MKRMIGTVGCLLLCVSLVGFAVGCSSGKTAARLDHPEQPAEEDIQPAKSVNVSAESHERLGDLYNGKGNLQLARFHYTKALVDRPDNIGLRLKKAEVLLKENEGDYALREFDMVLREEPHNADAHQGAGEAYLRSGLLNEAKSHFNRALEQDFTLWRVHNYLGIIYNQERKITSAMKEFAAALHLKPGQAEVLNNLGVAYTLEGLYAMAVETFQEAVKAGADDEKTHNNLGLALAKLGRYEEALAAFKESGDEARAYNNLGYVLYMDRHYEQAIRHFEKALRISPTYYEQAGENLKQATLALRFRKEQSDQLDQKVEDGSLVRSTGAGSRDGANDLKKHDLTF